MFSGSFSGGTDVEALLRSFAANKISCMITSPRSFPQHTCTIRLAFANSKRLDRPLGDLLSWGVSLELEDKTPIERGLSRRLELAKASLMVPVCSLGERLGLDAITDHDSLVHADIVPAGSRRGKR